MMNFRACKSILPKIDLKLIEDFLYHQQEDHSAGPMYSIEVTTKAGLDTQEIKDLVWNKIEQVPDVAKHGTLYRIEHKLTLDTRRLSDHDFVLKVKGSYIGYF